MARRALAPGALHLVGGFCRQPLDCCQFRSCPQDLGSFLNAAFRSATGSRCSQTAPGYSEARAPNLCPTCEEQPSKQLNGVECDRRSYLLVTPSELSRRGSRCSRESRRASRKMSKVPCLLSFDDGNGLSVHGVAAETESGKNSGIDTLMRTLSEKRLIDDRAATLEGSWMQRITDSANGRYFHSTMTPFDRVPGWRVSTAIFPVAPWFVWATSDELTRYDEDLSG